jgi:hypothetical protein
MLDFVAAAEPVITVHPPIGTGGPANRSVPGDWANFQLAFLPDAQVGSGRIVTLYYRSSTLYQIY